MEKNPILYLSPLFLVLNFFLPLYFSVFSGHRNIATAVVAAAAAACLNNTIYFVQILCAMHKRHMCRC